jgi:hypothetical protein
MLTGMTARLKEKGSARSLHEMSRPSNHTNSRTYLI